MYTGPKLTNDDLVFGYDSGYGVADNDISTIFYPGEPTTNYADDTVDAQGGWGGGYSLIDSATKKFRFNVNNFAANPGAGWRCFVWDMRAHAGSAVTISATVEVPDDSPGDFAWIMIGQSSSGSNGTSSANYHGYSATSERYQKSTKNTERITWSGTIGNTGTANQPNGYIGFTIWYNNGTPGTNSYVDISNIQIEKISHATPFVNGSRSNTASLIDLKRTTSIDVGDVSFNSTGQPDYDGTNDHIVASPSNISLGTSLTYEVWIYPTGYNNSRMYLMDPRGDGNTSGTNTWFIVDYHQSPDTVHVVTGNSGIEVQSSNFSMPLNNWHHLVATRNGNSWVIYHNGVSVGTGTTNTTSLTLNNNFRIGTYASGTSGQYFFEGLIAVAKIYNAALSATQVEQNYNAYKNRFNI